MNNSLPRLIDGMVATLRKEVIPRVEGDYARGQTFGVIYMLKSLKLRCIVVERLSRRAAEGPRKRKPGPSGDRGDLPGAPLPDVHAPAALPDASALEAMRDAGDASLCDLIDWLAANRARVPAEAAARAESIVDAYLARQAKYEISTSAKPMFVEMSGGAEKT